MPDINLLKKEAALKAVEYVQSGMVLGLGTGSTVFFVLEKLGELIRSKTLNNIVGIPSSEQTAKLANEFGIPLTTFTEYQKLDLTIDGADEVDSQLNLIKGGGGALLREKVLAQNSDKLIIVVDESKISQFLGEKWHIPIEVIPFAAEVEKGFLESIGAKVKIRETENGEIYRTDENNFILDSNFGVIADPAALAEKINERAGIVEHGLFYGMTDLVISASKNGIVEIKI